jgi:hypothetical protein
MNDFFVDASFWIAFRGKTQAHHGRAVEIIRELRERRARLVTTYLTFAEIHAAFSRIKSLRAQVVRDFTEGGPARIESPQNVDYATAFTLLAKNEDKSFSFCDAVSFAIMKRMGIRKALSFDDHFRQIGEFEILN